MHVKPYSDWNRIHNSIFVRSPRVQVQKQKHCMLANQRATIIKRQFLFPHIPREIFFHSIHHSAVRLMHFYIQYLPHSQFHVILSSMLFLDSIFIWFCYCRMLRKQRHTLTLAARSFSFSKPNCRDFIVFIHVYLMHDRHKITLFMYLQVSVTCMRYNIHIMR